MTRLLIISLVGLIGCAQSSRTGEQPSVVVASTTAAPAAIPSGATSPAKKGDGPPTTDFERCDRATIPSNAKLQLIAKQVSGGAVLVDVGIQNLGTEPVCVWSHVATHETQSDWLSFELPDPKAANGVRTIALWDDRDKSAPVSAQIAPGQTLWRTWDLASWATRRGNGARPLSRGKVRARATYDSSKGSEMWKGKLDTSFDVSIP